MQIKNKFFLLQNQEAIFKHVSISFGKVKNCFIKNCNFL